MTDRLSLTNALADGNIDRKAAERIASEIFDFVHQNVAAKADLDLVRAELLAALGHLEATSRTDLQLVKAELKADIAAVRADLDLVKHQLITRLGGLAVVLTGVLFAALHYWPPHG